MGLRRRRFLIAFGLLLLVLLLALRFALEPQRASAFLLSRVGASLGLEITASGAAEYRLRNLVERLINRLKQFRRVATRYEKLARNYEAMLIIAAIRFWLTV